MFSLPLLEQQYQKLADLLKIYHYKTTVSMCAALMTVPSFVSNAPRIELLTQLAVANCRGKRRPTLADISRWLNKNLSGSSAMLSEDPPEDVFISNVATTRGNFRIFQGIFVNNEHYLSRILNASVEASRTIPQLNQSTENCLALLALTDAVCQRLNLSRWAYSSSSSQSFITISPNLKLDSRANALIFTPKALAELGIDINQLWPFMLTDSERADLEYSPQIANSKLRQHPIIQFGEDLVLANPHAAARAARHYLYACLCECGLTSIYEEIESNRLVGDLLGSFPKLSNELTHRSEAPRVMPKAKAFNFTMDAGHIVEIIFLDDDVKSFVAQGEDTEKSLETYEEDLRGFISNGILYQTVRSDFRTGTTIVVFASYGRPWRLRSPAPPPGWDMFAIDYADLELLLLGGTDEFLSFLKSRHQIRWAEERGVSFINPSGAFGHFCHWVKMNYLVMPFDAPINSKSSVMLIDDAIGLYRSKKKSLYDVHASRTVIGEYTVVQRHNHSAYFPLHVSLPLFSSRDAALAGTLATASEHGHNTYWLISQLKNNNTENRRKAYFIWSNIAPVFSQFCVEFSRQLNSHSNQVVEIYLDVDNVLEINLADKNIPTSGLSAEKAAIYLDGAGKALVILPPEFYIDFMGSDNRGERNLLLALGQAIHDVYEKFYGMSTLPDVQQVVDAVLPIGGGKLIHVKAMLSSIDYLLGTQHSEPLFIAREDMVFSRISSANVAHTNEQFSIVGANKCTEYLNDRVYSIWKSIRSLLIKLNKTDFIEQLIRANESIMADSVIWRESSLAVLSIHGRSDGLQAAFEQEQRRSKTALASRILMEMGICECMASGGEIISRFELQRLLAMAAMIVETAYDSDAIHGKLSEAKLLVFPNGDYQINRDYQQSIMLPFISNIFSDAFDEAAAKHSPNATGLAKAQTQNEFPGHVQAEFSRAFSTEFGLSPTEFAGCISELMEIAVEKNNSAITITLGEIRCKLTADKNLSSKSVDMFIKNFCLMARTDWETLPKGFLRKDTFPWLFRRRLSVVMRPVLLEGKQDNSLAFFGLGQLRRSANYILATSRDGRLPQEFFTTKAMRAYVGYAANHNGAAFEDQIVELFQGSGWSARARVKMTELGGTPEQGDVDVLAWKASGYVFAVECKWLQPAKTVGEVAEVLTKFAGEEKDRLARHLARIEWLRENPHGLTRATKIEAVGQIKIHSLLVTDADVPMMYVENLPIPTSEVIAAHRLGSFLASIKPANAIM